VGPGSRGGVKQFPHDRDSQASSSKLILQLNSEQSASVNSSSRSCFSIAPYSGIKARVVP
jgi:hypothetical protein